MKPKECVNSDCTEIFYVEEHKLDLPLQCEKCITKREKTQMTKEIINQQIGQIETSIEKIEPHLNRVEFAEYCDSAYTMIAYWKRQIKLCNDDT